jgi:peptidoglycan/xylan/chitin deacetylase (PgdA/CDA1 family)
MWTVDSLGWKGVPAAEVIQRCLGAASPGEIILMHVGSASTDAAALPALINALQARGYGFQTVGGMM